MAHHEWGNVGYWFSTWLRFLGVLVTPMPSILPKAGGLVLGATHAWDSVTVWEVRSNSIFRGCSKNTEMIVYWSGDPESTSDLMLATNPLPGGSGLRS